jgi:hypothetical protein
MRVNRLRKNPGDCHPEEPQAVLSEAKEGSRQFVENTTAEILRSALLKVNPRSSFPREWEST